MINTPGHVKDVQANGNGVYMPPNGQDTKDGFIVLQALMMQELFGNHYVSNKQANDELQATNPNAKVEGLKGNS
jgi:hypothetical protein